MPPRGTRRTALVTPIRTGDAKIDRAQTQAAGKVNRLLRGVFSQVVPLEVALIEGVNKVGHGLGVPVAYFTHAVVGDPEAVITSDQEFNPMPHRQIWVRLTGASSCGALLFLFPVAG